MIIKMAKIVTLKIHIKLQQENIHISMKKKNSEKSRQAQAGIRTQGHCVRSTNSTSVLCCPQGWPKLQPSMVLDREELQITGQESTYWITQRRKRPISLRIDLLKYDWLAWGSWGPSPLVKRKRHLSTWHDISAILAFPRL